jgi:hypothetical protein
MEYDAAIEGTRSYFSPLFPGILNECLLAIVTNKEIRESSETLDA